LTNGELNVNGVTIANHLILNGPGVANSGALTGTGTAGVSGPIVLDTGAPVVTIGVANAGDTLTLSGVVSDLGAGQNLTKVGSGTLILSNVNTYRGSTALAEGTISIGASSVGLPGAVTSGPLGRGTLLMSDGTTLSFLNSGNFTVANAIKISGTGTF